MVKFFRTRRGKLTEKLEYELDRPTIDINQILKVIDEYERDNLNTINKLKRDKLLDIRKINGALRQTINAHGPISKNLVNSASKRIYGALLHRDNKKKSIFLKILKYFRGDK